MKYSKSIQRSLVVFSAVLLSALAASAQGKVKVSLSDLVFRAEETKEISIILDNEEYVGNSIAGDIVFPEGFTFKNISTNPSAAGIYVTKTSRCPSAWEVGSSTERENPDLVPDNNNGKSVLRMSALYTGTNVKKAIAAGSGAVFTFTVTAPDDWNPNNKDFVYLRNFAIGGIGDKHELLNIQSQKIDMLNSNMQASFSAQDIEVTPNHVASVTVSLDNTMPLCGFDFLISLPDSLSFEENEEGDICMPTERLHATSYQIVENLQAANRLKVIIHSSTNLDIQGESGALFTFNVKGSAEFEEGKIVVSKINGALSVTGDRFSKIADLAINVTNPDVKASAETEAAVKALEDKVTETLKAFGEYPDSIQTVLQQQREALENALAGVQEAAKVSKENGTAAADLEALKASVAEVEAMAGQLLEDAAQAQKDAEDKAAAEAANAAQHDKDVAAVDAAQAAYEAAVAGMAEYDESVKAAMAEAQAAAQKAVAAAKEAAEASFAAGTSVADKDKNAALLAAANAAISKLAEDAKQAQEQFVADQKAANAAQHDKDVAAVDAAQAAYEAAVAGMAEYDESVKAAMAEAQAAAQKAVAAAKEAAEASFAAGTSVADKDKNAALVTAANAAISKLAEDAKQAQTNYETEQALNAAYAYAQQQLAELNAALAAAVETIATECADVKDSETVTGAVESVKAQVAALGETIDAAKADGSLIGKADELLASKADIETAISKLVADAKQAQANYEDEQALNAAYAQATEVLAGLNEKLEAALEAIATFCPDVKDSALVTEAKAAIETQIAALGESIEAKKADGTLTAELEAALAPKADIMAAISQMLEDARKAQKDIDTGVEGIEGAENISQIYTLSGKRVSRVEKGNVYIIRLVDGSTKKIMVK